MTSETERLFGRKEGSIGWVVFNNPEQHNAISRDMWAAIPKVLAKLEADPDIRVIVYKGAGDKAFVSGADISEFESQRANPDDNERYAAANAAAHRAMESLTKPSIAMIKGYCLGGGLAIALTCDLRLCSDDSLFGIPAARLGLGYAYEGLKVLADLVGPAVAKDIMFTARRLPGAEALRVGLVNATVAADQLDDLVRDYARMIVRNAPLTIKAAKMAIDEAVKDPEHRDLDRVSRAIDRCFDSTDLAEGRRAFMEKRPPLFQGK